MQIITKISPEKYLIQEAKAETKSEYYDGEIVAMAGAQKEHNLIVTNLIAELAYCLKFKNCKVYPSDMLLKLPKCAKYVYPDVMIVCENEQFDQHRGLDVLLNPIVIIEVLSESTASFDRNEKLKCYLELENLQEYIMVDSEELSVESYQKNKGNNWIFQRIKDKKEKVKVKIYDCEIALEDIYRKVEFEKKE